MHARHHGLGSGGGGRRRDPLIVGGNNDMINRLCGQGPPHDVGDHGLTGQVRKGLAGKTRGTPACWDRRDDASCINCHPVVEC